MSGELAGFKGVSIIKEGSEEFAFSESGNGLLNLVFTVLGENDLHNSRL